MAKHPAFVLVPGAWHVGDHWRDIVNRLNRAGFDAHTSDKPSTGKDSARFGVADDAAVFRTIVEDLCSQGKDVIVVTHSYGGLVGSCCFDGLTKNKTTSGERGGVIGMVAVSSVLLPVGGQMSPTGRPREDWYTIKDGMVYLHFNGEKPPSEDALFHDCSAESIKEAVQLALPQSLKIWSDKVPVAGWAEVPVTVVVCEQDRAISLERQETWLKTHGKNLGEQLTVKRLDCAHSPFLNMPEELTQILVDAAKAYSS